MVHDPLAHDMKALTSEWDSDAWFRGLVESAVDGILTINEKGVIHHVNAAALRMFGFTREELLGQNISMIMPDTSIVFRRIFQVTENVVQFRINIEFRSPVYAVEEYENFKEFYKQLFTLLTEQVVFRRKENS